MAEHFDPATAVTVGRIVAPHGLRGEVKVEPLTGFTDRFQPGSRLWLGGAALVVERCRWSAKLALVKFAGVDDRNAAEELRGASVQAGTPHALAEGTFYVHDIIGLHVLDRNGTRLGEVADVFSTGPNDVYVVRGERGELLLPATDDVVLEIDPRSRTMTIDLVEGLQWERPRLRRTPPRPTRSSV